MLSSGVIPGTIQVPPSGQPIILMGDAQTTGGYPRIGVVIRADLWKLAQAPLNGQLRLVEVDAAAGARRLGRAAALPGAGGTRPARCRLAACGIDCTTRRRRSPMQIDLNADLGEGAGNDEALLALVSSANIACGWHAGDAKTMRQCVRWALDQRRGHRRAPELSRPRELRPQHHAPAARRDRRRRALPGRRARRDRARPRAARWRT